jgi:hypothetical protein
VNPNLGSNGANLLTVEGQAVMRLTNSLLTPAAKSTVEINHVLVINIALSDRQIIFKTFWTTFRT